MSHDQLPGELEADFAAVARLSHGAGLHPATPTTLLDIGGEHLVVLGGRGDRPETMHRLGLGAARIARDHFHHDPPTSREIERAIDFAEDEIMRLDRASDVDATLWGTGPSLRAWGAVSGPAMTIELVEQWFQRLASAAHGGAGGWQGLPAGREAAATLLVLREFMHHRGHSSIAVFARPGESPG